MRASFTRRRGRVFHQYSNVRTAVAPAMISSERTADRTLDPADELITLSMVVVGALTTALGARTVVLDVDATVVLTEVVVARVVVVVMTAAARRIVVVGGSVTSGAAAGPTAVVAGGNVVDGAAVVAGGRVVVEVVLDVELVVVDGGSVVVVLPAKAGAAKTLPSNSSAKVNPARTRVLVGDDRRLTESSSD